MPFWWWLDHLQLASSLDRQQRDVELQAVRVGETLGRVAERAVELASSPLLSTALTDSAGREDYLRPYLGGIQSINDVPVELLLCDFQGNELARNGDLSFTEVQRRVLQDHLTKGESAAVVASDEGASSLLLTSVVRYPGRRPWKVRSGSSCRCHEFFRQKDLPCTLGQREAHGRRPRAGCAPQSRCHRRWLR